MRIRTVEKKQREIICPQCKLQIYQTELDALIPCGVKNVNEFTYNVDWESTLESTTFENQQEGVISCPYCKNTIGTLKAICLLIAALRNERIQSDGMMKVFLEHLEKNAPQLFEDREAGALPDNITFQKQSEDSYYCMCDLWKDVAEGIGNLSPNHK